MTVTDEMRVVALTALGQARIPLDMQEVLVHGAPWRSIPPFAIDALISAVAPLIAAQEREECVKKLELHASFEGDDDARYTMLKCAAAIQAKEP